MKSYYYIFFVLILTSCVSKKAYMELENKNTELSYKIDDLNIKVDSLSYINENRTELLINQQNEIEDLRDKVRQLSEVSASAPDNESSRFNYFYTLKPSAEIPIANMFKNGKSFEEQNDKLIEFLQNLGYDYGYYKYFYAVNGYGVVTFLDPINKEGSSIIEKRDNPMETNCRWFDIFCTGKGYYRMYVFLIIDKLPSGNRKVDFDEVNNLYNVNENLDYNWYSLPAVAKFITDKNNVYSNKYSFVVRIYDFKKDDFGDITILGSPVNSDYRQKLLSKTKF